MKMEQARIAPASHSSRSYPKFIGPYGSFNPCYSVSLSQPGSFLVVTEPIRYIEQAFFSSMRRFRAQFFYLGYQTLIFFYVS